MALVAQKRPASGALTVQEKRQALIAVKEKPDRFSKLMAPTMKLDGHQGPPSPAASCCGAPPARPAAPPPRPLPLSGATRPLTPRPLTPRPLQARSTR